MSKLTNCQINATLSGMESTMRGKAAKGDATSVRRLLKKIDAYRAELAARLAVGENPGSEIQTFRTGER